MGKIKVIIIGAGVRGRYTYGTYFEKHKDLYEVVAVVENKVGRRNKLKEIFNLDESMVYENLDDFFKKEKFAHAVIISTMDNSHYEVSLKSLQKGYDVLVEGPVVNSLDQLIHLNKICEENKDKIFMPAMNYRYSAFFDKLKNIIDSNELGQLININYNSFIGYEEFAHKYVRGNWRLDSDTAPIFLTNSCYDLDILEYLTNSYCEKVSAFGDLNHFKGENITEDMSQSCEDCLKNKECIYYAREVYLNNNELKKAVHIEPTDKNVVKNLKINQYGQCVYTCDNNVCDNLVGILKLENNINVNLNISAFTKEKNTNIRLMFTGGEVYGELEKNLITIKKFNNNNEMRIRIQKDDRDEKMIEAFLTSIKNKNHTKIKSKVSSTISSHLVAFCLEFARINESVVNVKDFYNEAFEMTELIENSFS